MKHALLATSMVGALALTCDAQNPLVTTFSESPGDLGSPTNVFAISADGTETSVTDGNAGLPTTGTLDGATGTFTWTWTAEDGGLDLATQRSISSAALTGGNVVTVTTATDHAFSNGQRVVISGLGYTTKNPNIQSGTVTVVDATTFTYTVSGTNADEVFTGVGGLATRVLNWDATTFTGELGTGWAWASADGTLGPKTNRDSSINTTTGEAVRMVFDLSNLSIPEGKALRLDGVQVQNSQGAGQFIYLDSGTGGVISLTGSDPGQIPTVVGNDVFQDLFLIVEDGDQIAFWRPTGSGQVRLKGFEFSIVDITDGDTLFSDFFAPGPGNNDDPTNVFNIHANGADTSVTDGNSLYTEGDLGQASGSFSWTWTAEYGGMDAPTERTIASASLANDNEVTVVTSSAHPFVSGDRVVVAGLGFVTKDPNVESASITVVDSTTFTYSVGGTNADETYTAAGGTATRVLQWDESTFTGALGNGWKYSDVNFEFGPDTPLDSTIVVNTGEAVRMVVDMSKLNLAPGTALRLDSFELRNEGSGDARFSFHDVSEGTITQLVGTDPGQIAPAVGNPITQPVNQFLEDGDEIALWAETNSGQTRILGFQFSIVIPPPPVLVTEFTEGPSNNNDPTNVFTIFADGSETSVTNGNSGLPTTGQLGDATGSFNWTWTAEDGGVDGASQVAIASAAMVMDTVTITTSSAHDFQTGDRVIVEGINFATSDPNVQTAGVTVVDATTFTYEVDGTNADEVYTIGGGETTTRVLPWDESTFTGVLGDGWSYNGGAFSFGPRTTIDGTIIVGSGEAVRMALDLDGLTIPEGYALQLDSISLQNEGNGPGRISFSDFSSGSITQLTGPGLIEVVIGADVVQPVNQIVEDGDEIALWRAAGGEGQLRLRAFQFSLVEAPEPGDSYATWAAGPFLGTLTDTDSELDFDGGGLETGLEYVLAGDPTDASDDSGIAPTLDNSSDPDFFLFTYRRSDIANADENTTITVEYDSSLSGWTPATPSADVVIEEVDGDPFDTVTVKIRRTLAVDGKLFVRLNVLVDVAE